MNTHLSAERMMVRRPVEYPFLESVTGPPLPYKSPRHLHEELEIAVNPGRTWQQLCRGGKICVPSDAVLLTPPEEPHSASSLETGKTYYIGLRLSPDFICKTLTEMTEHTQTMLFFRELLVDDISFSSDVLSFHHALHDKLHSQLEQDALLQNIVLHLVRFGTSSLTFPAIGQEPGAIQVTKAYIQEHYQENISLHFLAQQVHLSPFYFSRIFHSSVGLPPHAYLTQVRISHAKRLLADSTPLAKVAMCTGFHSQSHLNMHFKRIVGVTLGQYAQDCGFPRVGNKSKNLIDQCFSFNVECIKTMNEGLRMFSASVSIVPSHPM